MPVGDQAVGVGDLLERERLRDRHPQLPGVGHASELLEVVPLFDHGALHPVIDRRFPLEQIADAHRSMESNANVGKILVDVTP